MRIEPPLMRPVLRALPRSINPKPHHTTADWNFQAANWLLDTDFFVSAPSSLQITLAGTWAVLKHSVSGAIPEGRIIEWIRWHRGRGIAAGTTFIFRNQSADGSAALTNSYNIYLKGSTSGNDLPIDRVVFRYFLIGTSYDIETKTLSPTLNQETFYKIRLTWWVSAGVLIVRLEYWDGSAWASLCTDFSDPNNRWATSATNRVGVGTVVLATFVGTWHDDTEIYRKV